MERGKLLHAYAFRRLGQAAAAEAIIAGIDPAQQPDGSFAYCSVHDPAYELTPSQCAIGPAWAILANRGTGIWDEVFAPGPDWFRLISRDGPHASRDGRRPGGGAATG